MTIRFIMSGIAWKYMEIKCFPHRYGYAFFRNHGSCLKFALKSARPEGFVLIKIIVFAKIYIFHNASLVFREMFHFSNSLRKHPSGRLSICKKVHASRKSQHFSKYNRHFQKAGVIIRRFPK